MVRLSSETEKDIPRLRFDDMIERKTDQFRYMWLASKAENLTEWTFVNGVSLSRTSMDYHYKGR